MGGLELPEHRVLGWGRCGGPGYAWTPDTPQIQRPPLPFLNAPWPGVRAWGPGSTSPLPVAAWPRPPTLQSPPTLQAQPEQPGEPRQLTLAVAAVGSQPVSGRGAAALEASGDVDAAVGADVAPGGQGALVDVCDSKAHPQRPARTAGPGRPVGRAAAWEGSRTGPAGHRRPQSAGAGAASETATSKGETEAQREEGPAQGHTARSQREACTCGGRRRNGELSRGDRPMASE